MLQGALPVFLVAEDLRPHEEHDEPLAARGEAGAERDELPVPRDGAAAERVVEMSRSTVELQDDTEVDGVRIHQLRPHFEAQVVRGQVDLDLGRGCALRAGRALAPRDLDIGGHVVGGEHVC
ncbi:hypothetical protein [Sorangium sp. So ce1099]|uniref:hypothetical protein n=1 Tax=Sorangium sp. So ce1099 TaxID=3133331 RepID=UPI003F5F95E9